MSAITMNIVKERDMCPLKLLPCPYCKAKPQYHINPDNGYQYADFHHENECFFTSLGLQHDNIGELMAPAWNRRAQ